MKYGLNYQGSKNSIVEELCELFPQKNRFYDLFGGGCAVTHRMLINGNFSHYYVNDINSLPINLFMECAHGNIPKPRWVSHDEFDRVKFTDAYAANCFSFGGDWYSYAYSRQIEPYKKALHYAIVEDNHSFADALGLDLHCIKGKGGTIEWRRLKVKSLFVDRSGELSNLERIQSLEYIESIQRLQSLQRLQSIQRLQSLQRPYWEIEILPDSIIYCDPPYKNTKSYGRYVFNYDKFYEWCRSQTELTFISEYTMPDDFVCIYEFSRNDCQNSFTVKKVVERLFIPRHQLGLYDENKRTLF